MATIYLGLGSNIDPEKNLRLAVRELQNRYGDLRFSEIYRSAAVGFDGPEFLNLVVAMESDEQPAAIHEQIEVIHEMAGRHRDEARLSSRALDIDLLMYDDLILDEPPLRLPRADILDYSFVLRPFAELAPDLIHPLSERTLADHWREFDAASQPLTSSGLVL